MKGQAWKMEYFLTPILANCTQMETIHIFVKFIIEEYNFEFRTLHEFLVEEYFCNNSS